MRNLNKILALVLALVMSLSLVTIASGADFTDADEIEFTEAVDVMTTIGVLEGHNTGAFSPKGTLTREQAAKIITYMLLGENADKLSVSSSRYSDVAVTRWSAPAIEYCATLGIVAGNGDNTFKPANTLTGYAFAKMLLTALGYKAETEGFVGSGWTINVARYAYEVGLDNGIEGFNWSAAITREQAAQMALNAIKSPLVAYKGSNTIIVNGAEVSFGSGDAYYVTTTLAKEQRISDRKLSNSNDYTVEFGERYFPKLSLDNDTDDFGRPIYTWVYDKAEIGSYINTALLVDEFTSKVTYQELYDVLGKSTIADYTLSVYIDGVSDAKVNPAVFDSTKLTKSNKATAGATGNGTLTQVFVDSEDKEITISIINTYLAKATSDYNSKKDTLALSIYGVEEKTGGNFVKDAGVGGKTDSETIYGDDFAIDNAKDGDFFLVTVANSEVQSIEEPDLLSAVTLSSFKKGTSVTSEGTVYDYSSTATYAEEVLDQYDDNNMKDTTYNLYLDAYGNMIGIDVVESESNYVFITGYESYSAILSAAKTEAGAIFMDGTMANITVKNAGKVFDTPAGEPLENAWYTYSTDKNGEYSLTPVAEKLDSSSKVKVAQDRQDIATEINKSHVSINVDQDGYVYGNDDTVYIGAKLTKLDNTNTVISGVSSTTVGVKNVKMESATESTMESKYGSTNAPGGVYALYKDNGYIIAAVVVGEDLAVSDNYAYIISDGVSREDYDAEADEWTWTRTAIINGEEVELKEVGSELQYIGEASGKGNMAQYGWYKVSYDADGYVVGAEEVNFSAADSASNITVAGVVNFNTLSSIDKEDVVLIRQGMNNSSQQELTLNGLTLYVSKNISKDSGISIMPDATAVLIDKLDGEVNVAYFDNESGNVKAALDAMQSTKFNGSIYFVMKDGVATSVIINDTDNWTTEPGEGGSSSVIDEVKLNSADGSVKVYNAAGGEIKTGEYSYTLYMRGPSQDEFRVAETGTMDASSGLTLSLSSNTSYYIVVDGVTSNTVTKA